jgi:hypothetical protein
MCRDNQKVPTYLATRAQWLHWLESIDHHIAWQTGNGLASAEHVCLLCFTLQAILQEQLV